jgi:hypothetical protein
LTLVIITGALCSGRQQPTVTAPANNKTKHTAKAVASIVNRMNSRNRNNRAISVRLNAAKDVSKLTGRWLAVHSFGA